MKENQKTMVSKASGSRKLKKNTLPKFEADVYSKIPSGKLMVFSVHYLMEQKIEITLEDVVSVCFLLFPKKFGLKKYPKWPDSAIVSRRWGDSRRKGYIAAKANLEYKLTSKGLSLVKKVEKILGVAAPKPEIKIQPAQPKGKTVSSVKKTQSAVSKEKTAKPVQKEKATLPAPIKKMRSIRAKKGSPAPVKQTQTPEVKVHPAIQAKKRQAMPVSKPAEKAQPIQPAKAPTQNVKPIRVKETKPAEPVIVQPVKADKAQAEKANSVAASHVTKEAKERAGKFTRLMERSDAYIHYKKNGSNSKIKEFDFRSLLLCTMESSAETLARNVNLFKGYAAIHHRQDLIMFLIFCEDKFSYLLKPQNKPVRKTKK